MAQATVDFFAFDPDQAAADDAVLATGQRASDYAALLLEMARANTNLFDAAIAMARPNQLEGRLMKILDTLSDELIGLFLQRLGVLNRFSNYFGRFNSS